MDLTWTNLDYSPYSYLVRHRHLVKAFTRIGIFTTERLARLAQVDRDIVHHDLKKGIPFGTDTFDAVYHSHLLEHFDREQGMRLLQECHRVLKPGAILRIVVPDLHALASDYVEAYRQLESGDENAAGRHAAAIHGLFKQMVRQRPAAQSSDRSIAVRLERAIRRSASDVNETHKWMYDRHSLRRLMITGGFRDVAVLGPLTSGIAGWCSFNLDSNAKGETDKPGSLYMEGLK